MLTVAMVAILASCTVTKRHYAPGYHVEWKHFSGNQKSNEITHSENSLVQNKANLEVAKFDVPASNMVATSESGEDNIFSTIQIDETKNKVGVSLPVIAKKSAHSLVVQKQNHMASNQPEAVDVQTQQGPDGITWLIYVALVLITWTFSGPIFIAIWTSEKNGKIDWKSVLISMVLWWCCLIPGLIYDIIWINKNCYGSLIND